MIAHQPKAAQDADVAVPRPRTAEPAVDGPTVPVAPRHEDTTSSAEAPILVAARLERSAALLTWVARLALLLAVGLVIALVLV